MIPRFADPDRRYKSFWMCTGKNREKNTYFFKIFAKWDYFFQNWGIIRQFWQKYSHFEKNWENFLSFSHDFLTISVSESVFLRYTRHRSLVVHSYCSQCALSANTANPCCICFLFPACVRLSAPSCCCHVAVLSCVRPVLAGLLFSPVYVPVQEEGLRLRKLAVSDTVSSTPPRMSTFSQQSEPATMPPIFYLILALLFGWILGHFLL